MHLSTSCGLQIPDMLSCPAKLNQVEAGWQLTMEKCQYIIMLAGAPSKLYTTAFVLTKRISFFPLNT